MASLCSVGDFFFFPSVPLPPQLLKLYQDGVSASLSHTAGCCKHVLLARTLTTRRQEGEGHTFSWQICIYVELRLLLYEGLDTKPQCTQKASSILLEHLALIKLLGWLLKEIFKAGGEGEIGGRNAADILWTENVSPSRDREKRRRRKDSDKQRNDPNNTPSPNADGCLISSINLTPPCLLKPWTQRDSGVDTFIREQTLHPDGHKIHWRAQSRRLRFHDWIIIICFVVALGGRVAVTGGLAWARCPLANLVSHLMCLEQLWRLANT